MSVLPPELRRKLEQACVRGRRAAEAASRAAIGALGVLDERPAAYLSDEERDLRRALRAKREQLGDQHGQIDLLAGDCAYEQWHRLLFARFLAENDLLIHPQFGVPVTLAECGELAADLGEPDAWAVASRFAAEILPGIFRLDDPCVRLRLAAEGRLALEDIVESLAAATFAADDALGWVYQHWQSDRKDEVNAAERKIDGADLAPVTQLFTENYMVRFLLENSLGAWWANRNPASPLLTEWKYLRTDDTGRPTADPFEGWPAAVSDVMLIDPCCGSGHFLVEAFGMLWRMRSEEEGLGSIAAQDAVLRDNLFGLELDPRCVQIAMFAVAMAAWKSGGGWRELPVPNIAASGLPVRAPVEDWKALAAQDQRIEDALVRLHTLFREADTFGSLIDPRRVAESAYSGDRQRSFDDVDWEELAPAVAALAGKEKSDPAATVLGADAASLARAARFLTQDYTLVVTNPPFLKRGNQTPDLREHNDRAHGPASPDLATTMFDRWGRNSATTAFVLPSSWTYQGAYKDFRVELLRRGWPALLIALGPGAFDAISGEIVNVSLAVGHQVGANVLFVGDLRESRSVDAKAEALATCDLRAISFSDVLRGPDSRIILEPGWDYGAALLAARADGYVGFQSGDNPRYRRQIWEVSNWNRWRPLQSTFDSDGSVDAGCDEVIDWRGDGAHFAEEPGSRMQGTAAWGKAGVAVSLMGDLRCALYRGHIHDNSTGVVLPRSEADLPAIWAFMRTPDYAELVRHIDRSLKVNATSLVKIPFDAERWRKAAEQDGPLPEPCSSDPTQWLFDGQPDAAEHPLQVAVARLLGYRWPRHREVDDLSPLADDDGVVCLQSVLGERTAADRLQGLLARAFGGTWSPARAAALLTAAGSKKTDLDSWLRDEFFRGHCQIFKNRPFIWHIWDGRRDGFHVLVNYHRLDRPTLGRLAYTYLGDWIERQAAGAREDVVGAEERLIAAQALQRKLELILAGERPCDIYVRWKPVREQAIGWAPDHDDGVRLNIRPFVQAGVLRAKFNVKWEKDRGKNADGSERHNDLHLTNAQKQDARDAGLGA